MVSINNQRINSQPPQWWQARNYRWMDGLLQISVLTLATTLVLWSESQERQQQIAKAQQPENNNMTRSDVRDYCLIHSDIELQSLSRATHQDNAPKPVRNTKGVWHYQAWIESKDDAGRRIRHNYICRINEPANTIAVDWAADLE
ncbi:MAG: hypothetical protein F6J87_09680 [Spirulina sp. SIO3F2]|nr:hypothetical protein [Spirulina sp. SIO3F2]